VWGKLKKGRYSREERLVVVKKASATISGFPERAKLVVEDKGGSFRGEKAWE